MGGRGMTVRLRYIQSFKDRHGHIRHYFRRAGQRTALPGLPGSPDFMESYHAALSQSPGPVASPKTPGPGTFGRLVEDYMASVYFKRTRASSQAVTKNILVRFASMHGHRTVAGMKRVHVEAIVSGMSETPAAANNLLRRLRMILNYAIGNDWITADPSKGVPFFREGTHHTWTDAELRQFEARWPLGTRQRTAFALALFTGQRRADVARMTWAQYDASQKTIWLRQEKTGVELVIPVHPDLKAALDAWPRLHVAMLANEKGQGTSVAGHGGFMAAAIAKAGLPSRCVLHGLRKAAARRLAEAGCTAHQIMAITGHKTLSEVERYTEQAQQVPRAKDAIARLGSSTPSGGTVNPSKKANRNKGAR
jgi:enterobacteria phage integrase